MSRNLAKTAYPDPVVTWFSSKPIGTRIVIAWNLKSHNGFTVYRIAEKDRLKCQFHSNPENEVKDARFSGADCEGPRDGARWADDNLYAVMPDGMTVEALRTVYELDHAAFMRVLEPWFDPRAGGLNG